MRQQPAIWGRLVRVVAESERDGAGVTVDWPRAYVTEQGVSEIAEACAERLVRLGRARPAGGCDQSGVEASHGRGVADVAVHGNSDFHAGLG